MVAVVRVGVCEGRAEVWKRGGVKDACPGKEGRWGLDVSPVARISLVVVRVGGLGVGVGGEEVEVSARTQPVLSGAGETVSTRVLKWMCL